MEETGGGDKEGTLHHTHTSTPYLHALARVIHGHQGPVLEQRQQEGQVSHSGCGKQPEPTREQRRPNQAKQAAHDA